MKKEIDWKKELIESGKFNNKFSIEDIALSSKKAYKNELKKGVVSQIGK